MSSPVWIVFRKELRDTLRDRRTLAVMVVVPLLLFPALMIGMSNFTQSRAAEAKARALAVAVSDAESSSGVADHLRGEPGLDVTEIQDATELARRVGSGEFDVAVAVPHGYAGAVKEHVPAEVTLHHKSSEDFDIPRQRVEEALQRFENQLLERRMRALGLEPSIVDPIKIKREDAATKREQYGQLVGGLLPYMFIIFCFTGGMYPAIDLAAGEKERGTLETLLSSPASRLQIVLGKFAVVTLAGFASAVLAALSLYVCVQLGVEGLPPELLQAGRDVVAPAILAPVFALLLPLSVFFAASLLMLSVYARSYKEAISVVSPLMIIVIIPAVIALAPGVRLGPVTALVPVLNMSLATRELIAGTAQPLHLALVFASLLLLAGAAVVACARWFAREDVVFRS